MNIYIGTVLNIDIKKLLIIKSTEGQNHTYTLNLSTSINTIKAMAGKIATLYM